MTKNVLLIAFFLTFIAKNGISQSNTGQIKYEQIVYTKDTLSFGVASKFHLFYKDNEVDFVDIFQSETINPKTKERFKITFSSTEEILPETYSYQNLSTKSILFNEIFALDITLSIADKMLPISWKTLNKSKKIKNIECFAAQAEYRGRVWTAWYAPSIPVSSGPWLLYGLPGIILEAEDLHKTVQFICESVITPLNNVKISKPKLLGTKREVAYNKDFPKKIKEMAEDSMKKLIKEDKDFSKSHYISSIEIFDFEKAMAVPRFQQKLSDIPKK